MAKSVFADLLTGFTGLGLVMAGFIARVLGQDLRIQVILAGVVFFLAGLFRGAAAPSNPWIKGLLVSLGAIVPVCAMAFTGVAFTSRPHLAAFVITSLLAAVAGVHARKLWLSAHRGGSLTIAACWAAIVLIVAQMFAPLLLEMMWTRHVNHRAPAFSFRPVNGTPITNESVIGHVAVLAFWATWCGPCREELPRLDALYARYKRDPNVTFLAVNMEGDDFAPSVRKASTFFTTMNLSLPLVISQGPSKRLGIEGLPTVMIIDPRGNVRLVHVGYDAAEPLERTVSEEIAALRPHVTHP